MLKFVLFIIIIIVVALIFVVFDYDKDIHGGSGVPIGSCDVFDEHAQQWEINHIPITGVTGGGLTVSHRLKIVKNMEIDNILQVKGNTFSDGTRKPKRAPTKWSNYKTWDDLKKHKDAMYAYVKDRNSILKNPNLDWSKVLSLMMPKLHDNYEYIGLCNLEDDGKTMYVSELHKSDIKVGSIDSETTFASVPAELVYKVGRIPALFMFHTHPADPAGSPLPSSHDLSTAIYYASAGHYSASMIISRYGILLYGISDYMLKHFTTVDKRVCERARKNFAHDVVAAHESMRSWRAHDLNDYIAFYKQYRLFLYIYPSSEFVATHDKRIYDLLTPIDYDVIQQHAEDINKGLD
jgi:hypothetical protein